MTVCLWKRFSLLLLLVLTLVSFGCSKKVAPAPPPPPPPPPPAAPAPTVTLTVDRASIQTGQSAVLSYTATNATSVTINPGIGAVQPATGGTRQVTPTQTTSFTARATGPGGSADSAAVNVTVTAAPPPPPPPPAAPTNKPAPPPAPTRTLDEIFTSTMVPILFDYDKATIRASEESKLLAHAAWLKQNPTVRFQIEGHADERGSQEYNIALGDERAAAVKKFLAGQGIADNRMTTISYGEERPACREASEDCFQRNRRAAFVKIQ
jgi:peptidoglycan-associated lipoprotein